MKKIFFSILIVILVITTTVVCFACDKKVKVDYVTVSFDTGFDDVVISPVILDGQSDKYMPADPVKLGYEFVGWFYDDNCTLPFSTEDGISMDITLHAKWMPLQNGGRETGGGSEVDNNTGFVYKANGESYYLIGYNGTDTEITVPARYNSLPVLGIKKTAFVGSNLVRINLGRLIEDIEEGTFRNLNNLKYINVESGNSHYSSNDGVLYNAQQTTLVCVPSKTELTTLTLNKDVSSIVSYALENSTLTLSFAAESAYSIIDSYDFAGFDGELTVGKEINTIRRHAFDNATCGITFAVDSNVQELPMQSFENYKGNKLVLPGTITKIYPYAFAGSTAEIDLSRLGLTTVSAQTFANYNGAKLVIPATVSTIERLAFAYCTAEITFEFGSVYTTVLAESFASFGGVYVYTDANGNVVREYRGKVTMPSTVNRVKERAFENSSATVAFDSARGDVVFEGNTDKLSVNIIYLK